jgi:hypothetical protein
VTVIATGTSATGETQAPILTPPPAANGVWESLDQQDSRPVSPVAAQPSPAPGPRAANGKPSPVLMLLVASGVLLLLIVGCVAVYFLFFYKPANPAPAPAPPPPRRLLVSKAGGEGTFPSLAHALRDAKPGETILLMEGKLTEPPLRIDNKKDIMIESGLPGGAAATFVPSGPGHAAIDLVNVENFVIRNVIIDAAKKADVAVLVSGTCPGVTLDRVTVRGFKKRGFHLSNVAGEAGRPITLDQFGVEGAANADAGVAVSAAFPLETRKVEIQNGRVLGPVKAGVCFEGALADVSVTGNRIYKTEAAFRFPGVPADKLLKATIGNNTVYDVKVGLDFLPAELKGGLQVLVVRNYFGKTTALTTPAPAPPTPPPPPVDGVTSADNGHDKLSPPGNTPIEAYLIGDPELRHFSPADDATFLRFPASGPQPLAGPGKVRVGAP